MHEKIIHEKRPKVRATFGAQLFQKRLSGLIVGFEGGDVGLGQNVPRYNCSGESWCNPSCQFLLEIIEGSASTGVIGEAFSHNATEKEPVPTLTSLSVTYPLLRTIPFPK